MYYTIYKITNIINGKIYIGCHKTENLNDEYIGSGKILKKSIEKYGVESFKKEYLNIFDNPEDMFKMESTLVNDDFIKENTNYNLKIGGEGGWEHFNNRNNYKNGMCGKSQSQKMKDLKKLEHKNGKYKQNYFGNCDWQQKAIKNAQLPDAVKRRKETHNKNGLQKGKNNSQYGTHWYCNDECGIDGRKRYKEGEQPDGWITTTEYRKMRV